MDQSSERHALHELNSGCLPTKLRLHRRTSIRLVRRSHRCRRHRQSHRLRCLSKYRSHPSRERQVINSTLTGASLSPAAAPVASRVAFFFFFLRSASTSASPSSSPPSAPACSPPIFSWFYIIGKHMRTLANFDQSMSYFG